MPPKRKQPSRVTRSGKAGNTTPLSNVKRRCQGFGPNRQSAASSCTVPEEDTVLAGGDQEVLPKLKPRVKSIEFITEFNMGEPCSTVRHDSAHEGLLLLGCENGVQTITQQRLWGNYLGPYGKGSEVAEHNGDIFISTRTQDKIGVVFKHDSPYGDPYGEKLFTFNKNTNHVVYNITASDDYIACIDHDTNTVLLYNRAKQTKKSLRLQGLVKLRSVCLTQHKSLLVTYFNRDDGRLEKLGKYKITKQEDLNLIWTCEDLSGANGVTVDEDGLIFVSDTNHKNIHVISDEGDKLYEIHHEKLPAWCGNISIRSDKMAVCGRSNSNIVLLFKIV